MFRLLPLLPALTLAGCPVDSSFVSLQAEVQTPDEAIAATSSAVGYDDTEGACFRVPGVSRRSGYAAHPEAALGAMWTQSVDCDLYDDGCLWSPTTALYAGNGIIEDRTARTYFDGFASFDDSASSSVLSDIFGTALDAGSIAQLTATRTYDGVVDLRDPSVALYLEGAADVDLEGYVRGFSWNVLVFEWEARFLREWQYDSFDHDETYYEIDGRTWVATGSHQLGYEVFACVLPIEQPPPAE